MTNDFDIHPSLMVAYFVTLRITVSTAVAMEMFPCSPALDATKFEAKICCTDEPQPHYAQESKSNRRLKLSLSISDRAYTLSEIDTYFAYPFRDKCGQTNQLDGRSKMLIRSPEES